MWDDDLDWVEQTELMRSYMRRKRWEARGLVMAVAEMMGATQGAPSAGQAIYARGKQWQKITIDQMLARVRE